MTAAAQTVVNESVCLDTKPAITDYQSSLSAAPTSTLMPKTVDYGHGHGMSSKDDNILNRLNGLSFKTFLVTLTLNVSDPGATVERISYGERIVLRPDPLPLDRGYEKGEFQSCKAYLSLLKQDVPLQCKNCCSLLNY